MGISDSISGMVNKAKEAVSENSEAVKGAVDKAGDAVDKATGGKHAEHVNKGQTMAKDYIEKMKK
jgi:hypothetical protein